MCCRGFFAVPFRHELESKTAEELFPYHYIHYSSPIDKEHKTLKNKKIYCLLIYVHTKIRTTCSIGEQPRENSTQEV